MGEPAKKVAITKEQLAAARVERAERRARLERAFHEAASAPPPAPSVRGEIDRFLRTAALGLATFAAFAPSALLSEPVDTRSAVRNLAAVLFLALIPAIASAQAERSPEAEDLPRSRFMHRFSPLALGALFLMSVAFPFAARWPIVEGALLLSVLLGFFLHVPRVRAIHLLVIGWGATASVLLDDRALAGTVPAIGLVAFGAALDRGLHVRSAALARRAPELRPPVVATILTGVVFAAVLGASLAFLPPMTRSLPEVHRVRAERPLAAAKARAPLLELGIAVLAVVALLAAYHYFSERAAAEGEGDELPPERSSGRVDLEPLDDLAGVEDSRWPPGPRRELVRRYLEHLARLARAGLSRRPGEAPLDVAAAVAKRAPDARDAEVRLAHAFHVARYGPEPVAEALLSEADEAAKAAERALGS